MNVCLDLKQIANCRLPNLSHDAPAVEGLVVFADCCIPSGGHQADLPTWHDTLLLRLLDSKALGGYTLTSCVLRVRTKLTLKIAGSRCGRFVLLSSMNSWLIRTSGVERT